MPKSEKRSFRYQERSREDVKERANMKGGGFDSFILPKFKRYKMRDGKNVVRILPPTWPKARHYGFDIWVNYGIGVDNQSYLSLSKMTDQKDPIEEARRVAQREGDEKLARDLAPRQRVLMWVIDRQDEDEGPQLFDAPFTVDKAIVNLAMDEDTKEVIALDDPENGCDFRFYKTGAGLKTDYDASKMKLLAPSPLSDDEKLQDEWLEFVTDNPVPDTLQYYDYEHIQGVFGGEISGRDDDDKPRRGRSKPADDDEADAKPRGRSKAPVEDDDGSDDEPAPKTRGRAKPEPEDDEEPEEKPRSRRKPPVDDDDEPEATPRRGKRAAVADDDDDADDAADEEDEAPKGKKGESVSDRLRKRRSAASDEGDDD